MAATLAAFSANDTQLLSPPQLYGLKAVGKRVSTDEDGVQKIQTKTSTIIYLFGYLVESINVTFTRKRGQLNDDCSSMWLSGALQSIPVQDGVGQVEVSLEEPDDYFVCLFNTGITSSNISSAVASKAIWLHQGSSSHITLRAVNPIMPFWIEILLILLLLTLSGLFSGLNLGLMALDKNELEVISRCGTDDEKRYAKSIAPIRAKGNYLLCSLLFGNVLVNSSLTILMDDLTSGLIAIIGSTLSIVVFGEIIPQAICSRHGLAVGAKTVYLTRFFMIFTFMLSKPISMILDRLLGDEIGNVYDRERLMEYIRVTQTFNKLEEDEVNIISGALGLKTKTAKEVMTRLEDVFMLPINAVLDFNTVSEISKKGYSRIPIYDSERTNIVALLHAKDLTFVDPDDKKPVRTLIEFYKHPLIHTDANEKLNNVLNVLKNGKSHMAFVVQLFDESDVDPYYEIIGLVTLEDVIEEILQMEIVDETDILTDNRKKQKRKEAHLRQDFSDFAKIGEGEVGNHVISPQMGLAIFQYLSTAIEPFSKQFITETVLRRLISQKIYYCAEPSEVDVTNTTEISIDQVFRPMTEESLASQTVLYEYGKPADYFIMILEGRVKVIVGNERLTYEAGPFTYFGVSALQPPEMRRSDGMIQSNYDLECTSLMARPPSPPSPQASDPLLSSQRRSSAQITMGNIAGSRTSTSRASSPEHQEAIIRSSSSNIDVVGLTTLGDRQSSIAYPPNPTSTTHNSSSALSHSFVPDFTVIVMETTIYMKIPRKVYLAAYRASLMDRQEDDQHFREEVDSIAYSQLVNMRMFTHGGVYIGTMPPSQLSSITATTNVGPATRIKKSGSDILRDKKFSKPSVSPQFTVPATGDTSTSGTLVNNMAIGANNQLTKRKSSTLSVSSKPPTQLTRRSTQESIVFDPLTGRQVNSIANSGNKPLNNNSIQIKQENIVVNMPHDQSSTMPCTTSTTLTTTSDQQSDKL